MENLIFGAFATLDGYREGDAANLGRTVYDRCTVVALCSAKAQNPACTVALLTNAPVPEPFRSQLTQGGVEIWDCPFTRRHQLGTGLLQALRHGVGAGKPQLCPRGDARPRHLHPAPAG